MDALIDQKVIENRKIRQVKRYTAQNMKFSIKDFFSKCDQTAVWSRLLNKSLMENFISCAVSSFHRHKKSNKNITISPEKPYDKVNLPVTTNASLQHSTSRRH